MANNREFNSDQKMRADAIQGGFSGKYKAVDIEPTYLAGAAAIVVLLIVLFAVGRFKRRS